MREIYLQIIKHEEEKFNNRESTSLFLERQNFLENHNPVIYTNRDLIKSTSYI